MDPYAVTGFRHDQTTGELDGMFPTPEGVDEICKEEYVYNHMDFTIIQGDMTGTVIWYCGSVDPENELGTFNVEGEVTCGDFAM